MYPPGKQFPPIPALALLLAAAASPAAGETLILPPEDVDLVGVAGVVFYQKMTADDPTATQPLPLEVGRDWAGRLSEVAHLPVSPDTVSAVAAAAFFGILAVLFARRCRSAG